MYLVRWRILFYEFFQSDETIIAKRYSHQLNNLADEAEKTIYWTGKPEGHLHDNAKQFLTYKEGFPTRNVRFWWNLQEM